MNTHKGNRPKDTDLTKAARAGIARLFGSKTPTASREASVEPSTSKDSEATGDARREKTKGDR